MARRKAPQNKAQPGAPENMEPPTPADRRAHDALIADIIPDNASDHPLGEGCPNYGDELTDLVIRDTQLRRLLKAEQNEWVGVIGRVAFREIAERIRAELNGKAEFEEDHHGA